MLFPNALWKCVTMTIKVPQPTRHNSRSTIFISGMQTVFVFYCMWHLDTSSGLFMLIGDTFYDIYNNIKSLFSYLNIFCICTKVEQSCIMTFKLQTCIMFFLDILSLLRNFHYIIICNIKYATYKINVVIRHAKLISNSFSPAYCPDINNGNKIWTKLHIISIISHSIPVCYVLFGLFQLMSSVSQITLIASNKYTGIE